MSEYPYIVYTDKKDVKVNGDTIESIAGDSIGGGGVAIFKATVDYTLDSVVTDATYEDIEAAYNKNNLIFFDVTLNSDMDVPSIYRLGLMSRALDIDTGNSNMYRFSLTSYQPFNITAYDLYISTRRMNFYIYEKELPQD